MTSFADSTLGRLRALAGSRPLLCPCVRVVLERTDGAILLHARPDVAESWSLPGGHIELGESAEQAARREVREETSLEIVQLQAFGHSSDPIRETVILANGHVCQYVALLLHTREFAGVARADLVESLALRWWLPGDEPLPRMAPHVRATVEAFLRYRAGRGFQSL